MGEAIERANEKIEASSLREFYDEVSIEVLRRASEDDLQNAPIAHRLRFASEMDALLDGVLHATGRLAGRHKMLGPACSKARLFA